VNLAGSVRQASKKGGKLRIVDENLLAEQTEKLTQHYDKTAAEPERKVVPLNG